MFEFLFMIEKPRPDLLTHFTTFTDLSVSNHPFLKAKMRQFGASGNMRLSGTNGLKLKINILTNQRLLYCLKFLAAFLLNFA